MARRARNAPHVRRLFTTPAGHPAAAAVHGGDGQLQRSAGKAQIRGRVRLGWDCPRHQARAAGTDCLAARAPTVAPQGAIPPFCRLFTSPLLSLPRQWMGGTSNAAARLHPCRGRSGRMARAWLQPGSNQVQSCC